MWYYLKNNQVTGPFDIHEMNQLISNCDITKNSLIWKDGMDKWKFSSDTDLNDLFCTSFPLAEAGTLTATKADEYYVCLDQNISGPYEREVIIKKLISGECTGCSLCWKDGMKSWSPISEVFCDISATPSTEKRLYNQSEIHQTGSQIGDYSTYDEVPFFRKSWFILVCLILFMPLLTVIFLTGDGYYVKNGKVTVYPQAAKVAAIILGLISVIRVLYALA